MEIFLVEILSLRPSASAHPSTVYAPFSVILEGPEGCQEALRKSVCSETEYMPSIQSCHLFIFLVEILSVSNQTTSKFSFVTPPKARSDLPPSLTHLQYMPSIQSCHLSNLAIYLVLPSIVLLSI